MKKLLILLVCFVAVTSILSGLALAFNPSGKLLGLPMSILEKTVFRNFLIPGIILTMVGLTNVVTAVWLINSDRRQYSAAIASGLVIAGWIIGQLLLIGNFNGLHLLYIGIGLFIVLIAFQLKGKWSV